MITYILRSMRGYKSKIIKGLKLIKDSDRCLPSLLFDFWTLKRKKGITFGEYYNYEFDRQSDLFKNTFLGKNEQRIYLDYLNPKKYYILARNKYLTHLLLDEYSIPKAQLYCYYSPEGRYDIIKRTSNDLSSTIQVLKSKNISSCVIKATEDSHGNNVFAVKQIAYTENDAQLTLLDDTTILLSNVLGNSALVFEQIIHQTAQLDWFNHSSVNTIRFMTCLYPDGSSNVIAAFIKIGRDGAFVDNAGSGGNVDAGVDVNTGKIYGSIIFSGFRDTITIEKHPDSNSQLNDVIIDNWSSICEKVCSFQRSMPFLKAIGWDIAITDEGPMVIEMNDFWDTTGQLFIGRGWREQIRQCYFAWKEHNAKNNISYPFERQNNALEESKLQKIVKYEFK